MACTSAPDSIRENGAWHEHPPRMESGLLEIHTNIITRRIPPFLSITVLLDLIRR